MVCDKKGLVAVFFAVLMVTSMVATPALAAGPGATAVDERASAFAAHAGGPPDQGKNAGGPPGQNGGGPPGHDRGDADVTVPELESNSSMAALLNATVRLNELGIEGGAASAAANETVEAINATLQEYRRLEYVDSRDAFAHLADAQRSLAALADAVDEDDAIVDEISRELYAAIDRSARLTVSDAQSVVAANDDEFRNRGQRQSAESALGNAIDALERADETVSQDASSRAVNPTDRATALTHLENAWKHAERALDTVEKNTEPTLSLSQGQAFERNGTIVVSLTAALSDVRPYAYDEAEVTIDGDAEADAISLFADESADATARGRTLVDVGADPENVTATVTATAPHDADRTVEATREIRVDVDDIVWDRPAPDEYREVDVSDDSSGVSVEVRGDGLHETDISVTDETPATDDPYRAGPMVRIESQRDIDDATVEIPLDDDALDREGNLSIVTWDPHSGEPWTAVETEIDRDAGIATAEVDHFSFFSVFRIDDWEDETSDTITLDENQTDGTVGNGSEIEKADFVFVIDESGSMSGAPIDYAEDAAKRFVGALTDDERAGLVGYASGASLDHALTTDHDALNRSLSRLYANGGTHTEAGLRVGLDHLESVGWENRSKVMILLSDGNSNSGSYPRRVAEDAADAGVEISTIGLGNNIDEDELREIAAITGGDFYPVEREEDLPDTFERVAENQTGVELTDTNGDGIPDLVAEMDLSMPTGKPGVVGQPLDLDPVALDTSGDGLLDNETVDIEYRVYEENNETKLTAQVTYAEHHPARIDTTGDGLTDREQLEGWEISYTNSREDSLEVLDELEGVDDIDDLDGLDAVFETDTVYASPLYDDTDGDGLSDLVEVQELGTNPEATDTTGDGITDDEAADPTLFDVGSPAVRITHAEFDDPSVSVEVEVETVFYVVPTDVDGDVELDPKNSYEVEFVAEDSAGLSEARLLKDGTRKDTISLSGPEARGTLDFESGILSSWADLFTGDTIVTLEVDDRHEIVDGVGTTEVEAIEVNGIGEEISDELRSQGLTTRTTEESLGFLEGMTTGAGETLGGILAVYEDPWEVVRAMREIPNAILNLDEIIAAFPEAIENKQVDNNPHSKGDRYYDDFRQGWYQGYVAWFVVEMVVPAGEAGKAIKSSDRLQSLAGRIDTPDAPRIRRAAEMAGQAKHTATAPVRYSRTQLSRALTGTFSLADDAAGRLLGSSRSTGKQVNDAKTAGKLDEQTVKSVTDGSGDIDNSFRRGVIHRAANDDTVVSYHQIDRAVQKIDGLDGRANTRAKRLVGETYGDGIRLIDGLDDDVIGAFFRMEDADGYPNFDRWDNWRENLAKSSLQADTEDINRYIRNVNKAGKSNAISGERGLVEELANPNPQRSDFRGQRGEAETVNRYNERVDNVDHIEIEPGNGDYDLRLERSQGDEFVEVKTPADDTSLNFQWWERQAGEMNKKYSNSPDVSTGQAILEVPVKRGTTDLDSAQRELRSLIETPPADDFSEVRIQMRDDNGVEVLSISVEPDS